MSRRRRTTISGTFLITSLAHDRRRIFQVDATARLCIEILQRYRGKGLYKPHAFVVMPDHIHLLLTTGNLPEAMKHIRGGFSHDLASTREVWQSDYDDREILTEKGFLDARHYIHQNPVRARLVVIAEDYPYSSAFRAKAQ